jgi:intracellular septation protein A
VVAYFVAELFGASSYVALLAGTVASGLRMLWVLLRRRKLDPFSLFLLILFGAGFALTFFTGDPRFILAKDAAMSCAAGVVLVGSCVIKRPLAYYAAKRFVEAGSAEKEQFESVAATPIMRARWFRVTLVWGIALLGDVCLRVAAIYLLPIGVAATVSQILMIAVYGLLALWSIRSARKTQTTQHAVAQS